MKVNGASRLYRISVPGAWIVYVTEAPNKDQAFAIAKQHIGFYGSRLKKKNVEREEASIPELEKQHGRKLVILS